MVATNDLAQRIMMRGPLAVRMTKQAINAGMNYGPLAGQEYERLAETILYNGGPAGGNVGFSGEPPGRFS
jgi:enoyl-CoA hydratase/carnithine racemase